MKEEGTRLYHSPAACSRVVINALAEIGADFEICIVNLLDGGQKKPDYLAINPRGKVPALRIGGVIVSENLAILTHLNERFGGLLPFKAAQSPQCISDLAYCAATLHPMVRQIMMPMRFTTGEVAPVKADGMSKFSDVAAELNDRLATSWWYGDGWSIVDVYMFWMYATARAGGFSLDAYPGILQHERRVRARPSFAAAAARENSAIDASLFEFPPAMRA